MLPFSYSTFRAKCILYCRLRLKRRNLLRRFAFYNVQKMGDSHREPSLLFPVYLLLYSCAVALFDFIKVATEILRSNGTLLGHTDICDLK